MALWDINNQHWVRFQILPTGELSEEKAVPDRNNPRQIGPWQPVVVNQNQIKNWRIWNTGENNLGARCCEYKWDPTQQLLFRRHDDNEVNRSYQVNVNGRDFLDSDENGYQGTQVGELPSLHNIPEPIRYENNQIELYVANPTFLQETLIDRVWDCNNHKWVELLLNDSGDLDLKQGIPDDNDKRQVSAFKQFWVNNDIYKLKAYSYLTESFVYFEWHSQQKKLYRQTINDENQENLFHSYDQVTGRWIVVPQEQLASPQENLADTDKGQQYSPIPVFWDIEKNKDLVPYDTKQLIPNLSDKQQKYAQQFADMSLLNLKHQVSSAKQYQLALEFIIRGDIIRDLAMDDHTYRLCENIIEEQPYLPLNAPPFHSHDQHEVTLGEIALIVKVRFKAELDNQHPQNNIQEPYLEDEHPRDKKIGEDIELLINAIRNVGLGIQTLAEAGIDNIDKLNDLAAIVELLKKPAYRFPDRAIQIMYMVRDTDQDLNPNIVSEWQKANLENLTDTIDWLQKERDRDLVNPAETINDTALSIRQRNQFHDFLSLALSAFKEETTSKSQYIAGLKYIIENKQEIPEKLQDDINEEARNALNDLKEYLTPKNLTDLNLNSPQNHGSHFVTLGELHDYALKYLKHEIMQDALAPEDNVGLPPIKNDGKWGDLPIVVNDPVLIGVYDEYGILIQQGTNPLPPRNEQDQIKIRAIGRKLLKVEHDGMEALDGNELQELLHTVNDLIRESTPGFGLGYSNYFNAIRQVLANIRMGTGSDVKFILADYLQPLKLEILGRQLRAIENDHNILEQYTQNDRQLLLHEVEHLITCSQENIQDMANNQHYSNNYIYFKNFPRILTKINAERFQQLPRVYDPQNIQEQQDAAKLIRDNFLTPLKNIIQQKINPVQQNLGNQNQLNQPNANPQDNVNPNMRVIQVNLQQLPPVNQGQIVQIQQNALQNIGGQVNPHINVIQNPPNQPNNGNQVPQNNMPPQNNNQQNINPQPNIGRWFDRNIIQPISNRIIQPISNSIATVWRAVRPGNIIQVNPPQNPQNNPPQNINPPPQNPAPPQNINPPPPHRPIVDNWAHEKTQQWAWDTNQHFGSGVPVTTRTELRPMLTGDISELVSLKDECRNRNEYLEALRSILENRNPTIQLSEEATGALAGVKDLLKWSSIDGFQPAQTSLQSVRKFILEYIKSEYNRSRGTQAIYTAEPVYEGVNHEIWQSNVGSVKALYKKLATQINTALAHPDRPPLILLDIRIGELLRQAVQILQKPDNDIAKQALEAALILALEEERVNLTTANQDTSHLVAYNRAQHLQTLIDYVNPRNPVDPVLPHPQFNWNGEYTEDQITAVVKAQGTRISNINDHTWVANLPVSQDGFQMHAYVPPVRAQDIGANANYFSLEVLNYFMGVRAENGDPQKRRFDIPINVGAHWVSLTVQLDGVNLTQWQALKDRLDLNDRNFGGQLNLNQQLQNPDVQRLLKTIYAQVTVKCEDSTTTDHFAPFKANIERSLANAYASNPTVTRNVSFQQTGANCGKYVIENGKHFRHHGKPFPPPNNIREWEEKIAREHARITGSRQQPPREQPQREPSVDNVQVNKTNILQNKQNVDEIRKFVEKDTSLKLLSEPKDEKTGKTQSMEMGFTTSEKKEVKLEITKSGTMKIIGAEDTKTFKESCKKVLQIMLASQIGTKPDGSLDKDGKDLKKYSYRLSSTSPDKQKAFEEACGEMGVTYTKPEIDKKSDKPDLNLQNDEERRGPNR